MTSRILTDWTEDQLIALLDRGIFEPEAFDFKGFRIAKKTDPEKQDIRKDCCAFANSFGGFLVYGVADDRRLPAKGRLIGIDKSYDFPNDFGAFPRECKPSIGWEFLNPAIDLGNGKVIHVVFIPRSWRGPHCVKADKPQEGFVFLKRTNKGNEYMNYEEVRMAFLGYYEKRLKLQLLQAELQNLISDAQTMMIPEE
jgi:predicted HTH transcriptional regulator